MATQLRQSLRSIPKRKSSAWGVCLHTTGSGLPRKAKRLGKPAMEVAIAYYTSTARGGPAYVIGPDAAIVQVALEDDHTFHVGSYGPNGEDRRQQYRSGEWRRLLTMRVVDLWRDRWPRHDHPWQLFPSLHPNADYIGIEIVPQLTADAAGLRFTPEQHAAAGRLCADIGKRWGWPDGWWRTSRLVGHEDVGLLDRADAGGGWDPGALRVRPYFSTGQVHAAIQAALRPVG